MAARGVTCRLWTDNGVFSKRGLDAGTSLLIETVQLPATGTVVDLGCGYGAVTVVLAKTHPALQFVALDVNRRAVDLARRNTERIANRVEVLYSDGFAAVPALAAAAVLLNPPIRAGKTVIYRLFEESAEHLSENGVLWVVMHKKHGADSAERKLCELGAEVERAAHRAGYRVLRAVWKSRKEIPKKV